MPLELGPDLTISINGYLIFKRQTPQRSCYIWQGGEKPQIVKGKTILKADGMEKGIQIDEIQKPEIQRANIQRAYTFGGEQVTFSDEEQKQLRNFGKPVVRVLGFKPLDDLPFWASIKPATFVYPSESGFVGSTRVFSALWQTLLKKERWALTWFIPRMNAKPRLAAMIAAHARLDEHGNPTIPGGLWIVPLPFVDDIRPNPPAPLVRAPASLVDKMSVIVEQLLLPGGEYNPFRYPNPALQYHYKIIQAIALDEDLPEKPTDKTIPKYKQIDKRAGPYVHEWAAELKKLHKEKGLDRHDERQTATVTKRRVPARKDVDDDGGEQRSRTKRVKIENRSRSATPIKTEQEEAGNDINEAEEVVRHAWETGTLSKCKVTTLKDFLSAHGEYASRGRKAQMIERVERILSGK
ncbi:ATP-dependent DNA helicase II subunit 1 [Ascosphaera aggregata]|nr:ATP-dependent DNA helicase II subunit 1 [Ascosphaera aggregata]